MEKGPSGSPPRVKRRRESHWQPRILGSLGLSFSFWTRLVLKFYASGVGGCLAVTVETHGWSRRRRAGPGGVTHQSLIVLDVNSTQSSARAAWRSEPGVSEAGATTDGGLSRSRIGASVLAGSCWKRSAAGCEAWYRVTMQGAAWGVHLFHGLPACLARRCAHASEATPVLQSSPLHTCIHTRIGKKGPPASDTSFLPGKRRGDVFFFAQPHRPV